MAKLIHVGAPAVSPDEYAQHSEDTTGFFEDWKDFGVKASDDPDGPFVFAKKSGYGWPEEHVWPSPPQLAKDKGWLGEDDTLGFIVDGGSGLDPGGQTDGPPGYVVDGGMGVYTTDPKDFGGKGSDKGDLFEDLPIALEDRPIDMALIFAKKSGYCGPDEI